MGFQWQFLCQQVQSSLPETTKMKKKWQNQCGPDKDCWKKLLKHWSKAFCARLSVVLWDGSSWLHKLHAWKGGCDVNKILLHYLREFLVFLSAYVCSNWYNTPPDQGQHPSHLETSVLIRSLKLSKVGSDQYSDGWLLLVSSWGMPDGAVSYSC